MAMGCCPLHCEQTVVLGSRSKSPTFLGHSRLPLGPGDMVPPGQHFLAALSVVGSRPQPYLSKLESVYFTNHTQASLDTQQLLPWRPHQGPCLQSANRPP